jgi:hypothetical protein
MRRASAWFAGKWVAIAAAGVACVGIAAYGLLEGYAYRLQSLQEYVAQMKATVSRLERKGGRSIVANCQGRLCIEVAEDQNGHWKNESSGARYVIPRGY